MRQRWCTGLSLQFQQRGHRHPAAFSRPALNGTTCLPPLAPALCLRELGAELCPLGVAAGAVIGCAVEDEDGVVLVLLQAVGRALHGAFIGGS